MLNDVLFDAAIAFSLEILSIRNSAPIYEYLFSYEAPLGFLKTLFHAKGGELHSDVARSRYVITLRDGCSLRQFCINESHLFMIAARSLKEASLTVTR
jgi:hypothetical protein